MRPASVHCLISHFLSEASKLIYGSAQVFGGKFRTDEIDKVSQAMQELLDNIAEQSLSSIRNEADGAASPHLKVVPLSTFSTLQQFQSSLDAGAGAILMPIYEDLLEKWIQSLSKNVPSKTRVWLEKIVRHTSVQLFLACHGIQRAQHIPTQEAEDVPSPSSRMKLTLPLREKATPSLKQEPLPRSSQSHATASQVRFATGSFPSTQETDRSDKPSETHTQAPGHVLAQYCSLKPQGTLPLSLQSLTEEWTLGADPHDFHWSPSAKRPDSSARAKHRKQARMEKQAQRLGPASASQHAPTSSHPAPDTRVPARRGPVRSDPLARLEPGRAGFAAAARAGRSGE